MTWILSILIVIACIVVIIFVPYLVGRLMYYDSEEDYLGYWGVGLITIVMSAFVVTLSLLLITYIHSQIIAL